jgi:hypothetical protein
MNAQALEDLKGGADYLQADIVGVSREIFLSRNV